MIIEIYGKQGCSLCQSAKKKIGLMLDKWDMTAQVDVVFQDMETVDGAAEGDFFDVFHVPSVLLKRDADSVLARWDGEAPPSEDLHRRLCA